MGGSGSELPGVGGALALSFVSLGLVCVVAYWVLRWLGRRGVGRSFGNIKVVGQCHLEPRRSLYLIESGGRCFLLGVGEGAISLIAELDGAALVSASPEAEYGRGGFGEVLSKVLGRLNR
jgi:flagellar biosynthetic protein FliO